MALGAQEDGANGPTSTHQQPLLHRRLSQRAPFESSKDRQPQQRTQPSAQPGNEYSKAPHQHRPQARFPRVQALLKAARRLSWQAADLLLWDLGFEDRPLLLRLNQTFKRLVYSWRSELQLLRQNLLSRQARDKFITALRLLKLSLLLVLMGGASGARKVMRQLRGQPSRLRTIPGHLKQTLQRLGKKQRKD
jgi:hypothetical protein